MPVQFFGQYLLERRIVSREQLLDAIAFQDAQNLKLGEYAVQRGYLSEPDAESVNRLQQTRDLRFGDAAIELGLLTPARVNELLTIQRNNHVYLGEALVRRGAVTQGGVDEALRDFKAQQAPYETSGLQLSGLGVPDEKVYGCCVDMTQKLLLRMWGVQAKHGAPTVDTGSIDLAGHVVQVSFSGQLSARFYLATPGAVLARAAKQILKEDHADAETCNDLLRELANVICGNVVALLARSGKTCEIQPPVSIGREISLGPYKGLHVPLVTPDGEGAVVLTF